MPGANDNDNTSGDHDSDNDNDRGQKNSDLADLFPGFSSHWIDTSRGKFSCERI